jgi:5'-AMP-activated protein kinase catalytic alpha subunit
MPVQDYEFLAEIGHGNYSTVWRARHILTGRIVAVKVISKSAVDSDPPFRAALSRELAITSMLDHPLTTYVFEIAESEDSIAIVQELAAGGSFAQYVNNSPLTESSCRAYFLQFLSVIIYLHTELHVVHRDLKLENILLDDRKNIRLADFGFSAVIPEGELLSERCGTPVTVAPEIVIGRPYGFSVDIWSLGICLFTMAVGRVPFYDASDVMTLMKKIVKGTPVFPDGMNPDLRDLIESLLQKDPAARIPLHAIQNHRWFAGEAFPAFASGRGRGQLNPTVLGELTRLDYNVSTLEDDLQHNRSTECVVAYKILVRLSIKLPPLVGLRSGAHTQTAVKLRMRLSRETGEAQNQAPAGIVPSASSELPRIMRPHVLAARDSSQPGSSLLIPRSVSLRKP